MVLNILNICRTCIQDERPVGAMAVHDLAGREEYYLSSFRADEIYSSSDETIGRCVFMNGATLNCVQFP